MEREILNAIKRQIISIVILLSIRLSELNSSQGKFVIVGNRVVNNSDPIRRYDLKFWNAFRLVGIRTLHILGLHYIVFSFLFS
jgi:hypothetical protein